MQHAAVEGPQELQFGQVACEVDTPATLFVFRIHDAPLFLALVKSTCRFMFSS